MIKGSQMTLFEHLLELRLRLLKFFFSIILFSIIGYIYSDQIINFLLLPIISPNIDLQVLKITSIFMTKISVSVFFGLVLSFPIFIYQLLSFLLPAFENTLTSKKIAIFFSIYLILMVSGILFGFEVLIPISI